MLERLAGMLREREVIEKGTIVLLAGGALHALAARRFRLVNHWEIVPGGWLPPPIVGRKAETDEPVGHLVEALEGENGPKIGSARSFSARLADGSGNAIDMIVRRVHRERRHAMSLDLWGSWTPESVKDVEGSVAQRLPVMKSEMTKFQYA